MDVQLITVPYRYDELNQGVGGGPKALLAAGFADDASKAGTPLTTAGDAFLDPADRESGRTAINIGKLGASTAALIEQARTAGHPCLVLAGDDTAAIGVVSGLQAAHGAGARIGVVWIDAHGDFNTPETSYSGILAGMSLAIVAGLAGPNWREAAKLAAPISTDRIIVGGARALDAKEAALLTVTDVRLFNTGDLRDSEAWTAAITRLGSAVDYIALHVDVDVLDPRLVPSSSTPSPDGLEIRQAVDAIGTVLSTGKVAAYSVCGINPGGGSRGKQTIETARQVIAGSLTSWRTAP
ncbi:MAG: arginase family protein [Thermomicrobiales bacterium]|nr:arginase family protein [Thermomicrobiales bacterium]